MTMDFEVINLNALAAKSNKCKCEGCEKLEKMHGYMMDKISKGQVKAVLVNGKKI